MSLELYESLIKEASALDIDVVDIHQFGEPLIDPDLAERVALAKKHRIPFITTNTNGSLLTREISESLIVAGLDQIIVSLDALTEGTYSKIRPMSFASIVQNILDFVDVRNEIGGRTEIILDFVVTPTNASEVGMFTKKWRSIVNHVCISFCHDWLNSVSSNILTGTRSYWRQPCRLLWTDLVISWDGKAPLCCQDFNNEVVLGSVRTSKLRELWNSRIINEYREGHLSGRRIDLNPCRRCNYISSWWG